MEMEMEEKRGRSYPALLTSAAELRYLLGGAEIQNPAALSKTSHVRLLPAPARARPRRRRSLVSERRAVRWRARRQTEAGEQREQRAD